MDLPDRRAPPPPPVPPFTWADMDKHMDSKLEPIHEKLDGLLAALKSSVPGGDLPGHCKAHESWLEEVEERKSMWSGVRKSILEWSVKSAVVGILAAGWYWVQGHIR